jgi:Mrp family chromosome partitioning ATPase
VLAAKQGAPRVLLVTSPQPGDARSTLSIDLAAAYARSGHRVLLVAAEQMRPGVPWPLREIGQGAARAEANSAELLQQLISSTAERAASASLTDSIRSTDLPNLQLLPFMASEQGHSRYLIPSIYWPEVVRDLRATADIVVFDGPSAMAGPEAALLAPLADGVVLALNPKTDNRTQIMAATARLGWRPDASLLGAVIVESGSTAAPRAVARAAQRLRLPKVAVTASGLVITLPTRTDSAQGAAWPAPAGHSSQD